VTLLLLLGCPGPRKATEIGNPELTATVRLATQSPDWIGPDEGAVLKVTAARVEVEEVVLVACEGEDVPSGGGGLDLLDPAAATWRAPESWCGARFAIAAGATFGGVDRWGGAFEVVDPRGSVASVSVPPTSGEQATVFSLDVAVWLEGVLLLVAPDEDGVRRVELAGSSPEGALAVWSDLDEDGLVGPGDEALAPAAAAVPDRDGDGLRDADEVGAGSDPDAPDSDGDALPDGEERRLVGTDPVDPDSDGDGAEDGAEVAAGSDPLDPAPDLDGDGFSGDDCDDRDPSVHPGAPEVVGDGVDQDCDGVAD
jgi:hypothetical protein